jgi:putative spermidine/putrescine transport system permease protein
MHEDRRVGYALLLPAAIFVVLTFLVPVIILLGAGVETPGGFGLSHWQEFWASGLNREVFWRSLRLGAVVTLTAAVIGYVVALAIVDENPSSRGRLIGLMVLPLMISPVARTYSWVVILGRTGVVNQVLVGFGLSAEPARILFSETAVFIGLLQLFMPLMILSLVSAFENMPADVVPASRILGAGPIVTFVKVIVPLTREGLIVGGTLVFTGSLTAYITPAVLGGSKVLMLETLLYQRINIANDIASAAVIATILIGMSFATNGLLRRLATARNRG